MKAKGWLDRGVRNLDIDPPARVHVVEHGSTLCGAPRGPGDLTLDQFRSFSQRERVALCPDCDDVIWNVRTSGR